jgi:hypothetical protein
MPQSPERPFAYSVGKLGYVFSVRPTLPLALDAARDRFSEPSVTIEVTAWFPDGSQNEIPYDALFTPDRSAWITPEQALQLEDALFPPPSCRPGE